MILLYFMNSSNIISFFKSLEDDGWKHSDVLGRVGKALLGAHQSATVFEHCQSLLEELRTHWYLTSTEKAMYTLLLAELVWTYDDKPDEMTLERYTLLILLIQRFHLSQKITYRMHIDIIKKGSIFFLKLIGNGKKKPTGFLLL